MDYYSFLKYRFPELETEQNFSFARHTSIGSGGTAAVAAYPDRAERLAELLAALCEDRIPYCFLGAGCNSLARDGFYQGVVVCFRRLKNRHFRNGLVFAGAGITGGELLRICRSCALGGFEWLAGIPTTVGGGVVMNAGVSEGHFSDVVDSVLAVDRGKLTVLDGSECRFGEKQSVFQDKIAVAGVYLRTKAMLTGEIDRRIAYFRKKREHLPKGRSMGCTFVNPCGESSGRLIERCGLKGKRIGLARISEIHANFIINEGARSADVYDLIAYVKQEVARQTNITLREEVRFLPD